MNKKMNEIMKDIYSKNIIQRILITLIAIFLLAVNYNLFLLHNNLVIGGTSGISIIIYKYFKINPATFIFIVNIFFIIISYLFLGPKTTANTIIGSLLYPLFVSLTSGWCAAIADKIILDNFILVVLISGLIFGVANGIIYKTGFTTGGLDTLILLLNKYLKIPVGSASLIINLIIIGSGGLIFGLNKAIYAVLLVLLNSFFVDKIMLGISDSKMFYIYTNKYDEIEDAIQGINAGYTLIKTEGGYTNKEHDIIMCVVPTSQYYMFKNIIESIDPKSFIIISDCYEVYGGQRKKKFPFI